MIIVAVTLPALAPAQPDTAGTDVSRAIPVHPSVSTVLQLPDTIVRAQVHDEDQFLVEGARNELYVRPHQDTPAGVEALIEVETRTLHRVFRVRVVEHAADAARKIAVPAVERTAETRPEIPPVVLTLLPAASAPPPVAQPEASHEHAPTPGEPAAEPVTENAGPGSPRLELSAHAVVALAGVTGLEIAGYEPQRTWQSHRALGLRLTAAPRGTWWALEAGVAGEWPAGPLVYVEDGEESEVEVSGPWFHAEVGMRARFGTRWIPSVYAGIGLQAHLRRAEKADDFGERESLVETMQHGALVALGVGLHYRGTGLVLGLDFQVRQGGPDQYRSMAALWTVGCFLDQGE